MKDSEPESLHRHLLKELIAGGAAGGLGKTCVAPLERTKILIQTGKSPSSRVDRVIRFMYQSDGILGFFRLHEKCLRLQWPSLLTSNSSTLLERFAIDRQQSGASHPGYILELMKANKPLLFRLCHPEGNGASVARIVPYAAIHFSVYERFRSAIEDSLTAQPFSRQHSSSAESSDGKAFSGNPHVTAPSSSVAHTPVWVDFVAGSGAGAVAVCVTYPLDLARTRLAWSMERSAAAGSDSIRETFRVVLQTEGVAGLYRGLTPTLLGILPYAGIKFYTYQKLKRAWSERHPAEAARTGKPPLAWMLLSGGTAGLLAQTLTYPIDIVRRRMQVEALQQPLGRAPPRSSMRAHAAAILKDNGIRGLFRGLSINYLKVVPSTAVGFTIYDLVKQALQLENHL